VPLRPDDGYNSRVLLYDNPESGNCYKVRLLLAHLGIEYERQFVDVVDRSNRRDLLGALNPALRVPTIILDDGRPLAESNAIILYFGEETSFVPTDRYERAQMFQWLCFEQYEVEPNLAVVRFLRHHVGDGKELSQRIAERTALGYKALEAMERHLGERDWFIGDRPSLADISLYAYTHVAHEGDFDLSPFRAVLAWIDRVRAMEGHVPIEA
jgi:glutathione S-transferase